MNTHDSIEAYITLSEYAATHHITRRRANQLIHRVPGAVKVGRDWLVPADAPDVRDRRYTRHATCPHCKAMRDNINEPCDVCGAGEGGHE